MADTRSEQTADTVNALLKNILFEPILRLWLAWQGGIMFLIGCSFLHKQHIVDGCYSNTPLQSCGGVCRVSLPLTETLTYDASALQVWDLRWILTSEARFTSVCVT